METPCVRRNPDSNTYCGPAALSAITGRHVDDVTHVLRIATRKRAIRGVNSVAMFNALALMDWKINPEPTIVELVRRSDIPTVARWLRQARPYPGSFYLLLLTNHWVVIRGHMLYDNRHRDGIPLTQCPYRRKRVKFAWWCAHGTNISLLGA